MKPYQNDMTIHLTKTLLAKRHEYSFDETLSKRHDYLFDETLSKRHDYSFYSSWRIYISIAIPSYFVPADETI